MNQIIQWCLSHWPYLTALVIFAVTVIVVTYKVTTKYHYWTTKISKSEKDCEKIEGYIIPRLTKIESQLEAISKSITALVVYLSGKDKNMDGGLFVTKSPVQLTSLGEKILKIIGGKTYIDANTEKLISLIEKENIKSALDVENYSKIVLMGEYNSDAFTPIKNYMFQHPIYPVDEKTTVQLDILTVNNIMGIYLRNKYFEEHPELKDAGA